MEVLGQAVAVLERSQARLEHAHALVDLGTALRHSGRQSEAREPLVTGVERARHCGATELVRRASHELEATGVRPRAPTTARNEALTPSERRIARMAAQGHSNPEIAQALFLTRRTVETHLTHAYRKLDIASRAELVGALAA